MNFELVELRVSDIAVASPQEFFRLGYRRGVPVVLLCRLPTLKHTSVIRCAPVDHYFRAVTDYPAFSSALYAYTSEQLIPNDSFHEGFLEEMRIAGISRKATPRDLFAIYAQWGAYGKKMSPALGGDLASASRTGRVASALVADEFVEGLIQHLDRQFEQFGSFSLQPAPEALNELVGDPRFSLSPRISGIPYKSADYQAIAANSFTSESEEHQVLIRLKQLVGELERAQPVSLDLFPLHRARLAPSIFLKTNHVYPSPPWVRAQLRARLVRLLGYVWHYPTILSMFEELKNKPLRNGGGQDQALAFDQILSDLGAYLADMRTRYPVIEENPLKDQESFSPKPGAR